MSQNVIDFSTDPSGAQLLDSLLTPMKQNILTNNSGTSRPSYAVAHTIWTDTTTTPWVVKYFDGTDDISVGTVNATTNLFTPSGIYLNKTNGTTAPTINDDSGDGYSVGSIWVDTTGDVSYICVDSTVGAAVWKRFTSTTFIETLLDDTSASAARSTLGVDPATTSLTSTSPATSDIIAFSDVSDSDAMKKTTIASILALTSFIPQSYISGFIPSSITGTSTTASITISAGQATDSTNAFVLGKATSSSWAVSNGNAALGYQGGTTLPNSDTIHLFACYGSSGVTIFAHNGLTPTPPSGYNTYYRRIASFETNGSGAPLPYTAVEVGGGALRCYLSTPVLDVNTALSTSRTLTTLSVIKDVKVKPIARFTAAVNGMFVTITSPDEPDGGAPSNTVFPLFDAGNDGTSVAGIVDVTTNTSGQIYIRSNNADIGRLLTRGWEDFRR